jgi:uncharacterized cupin superfamily protein
MSPKPSACLRRRAELDALELERFVHPHNPAAVRHGACLTDALGFTDMGVHLVRVKPGDFSSEHHFHEEDEEFVYLLAGRGIAFIGNERFDVEAGDFMAFPKHSAPHHMVNRSESDDLVYLVGGTRAPIDVVNYPRLGRRQYRLHGKREWVEERELNRLGWP